MHVLILALLGQNPAWPAADPDLLPSALARPEHQPADPSYAPGDCTGQLALYSFAPACAPALEGASGVSADRAWLVTTGRPEVTIALVGTGADWSDMETITRWRLNGAEIPLTDVNADGAVTVLDFTSATGTAAPTLDRVTDPRLVMRPDRGDANGNGVLDPQDLIQIFSDGIDDDGNGFDDDICGWDFVGDDNDPEASDDHGPDQARITLGVANNGQGGAGVCPRCTGTPIRAASTQIATATQVAKSVRYASGSGARVISVPVPLSNGGGPAPGFLLGAVDQAEREGALIVAGALNLSSIHQRSPWDARRVRACGGGG